MSTIAEIVDAAARLTSEQLQELRQRLDELEEVHWQQELARTGEEFAKKQITDEDIDNRVLRRRRVVVVEN